jgi:tRNA A-37 threonylcarbamoyl transferase component Bud32
MIPFSRLWKGREAGRAPAPAPAARDGNPLAAGSVVGRCLLLRPLGEGAYGRVFHAHHQTLNIQVALKLLQPSLFEDPRVHEQLRHEAQLLARLNHPNVVRVWDFEDDPARPYIVMEYVEGPSLADLIGQCGRLAPDRVVQLLRQAARGLNAAWKLGIVHRDLKPANVLLTRGGEAKLADLGLAVVVGPGGVGRTEAAGTPLYAAPELCSAPGTVDQRSDLYSLGATFYHALTGAAPFAGSSVAEVMLRHATDSPAPPHERVPGLPPGLSAVILRLLAKDPDYRYQDYEELLTALDGLEGGHSRARPTAVAPRASLEATLRTDPLAGPADRPAAPAPAADAPRRADKGTKVVRPIAPVPEAQADPPRAPSAARPSPAEDRPASAVETRPGVAAVTPSAMPVGPPEGGRLGRAVAAAEAGRVAEALALLRELTRQEPGNEAAWLWLARAVGPGAEAAGIYERLLERDPGNVTARQGILGARLAAAAADARSGNRAGARAALQKLLDEYPDLEEVRVGLARLAEAPEEAAALWREVLRRNPGQAEARAALARRGRR